MCQFDNSLALSFLLFRHIKTGKKEETFMLEKDCCLFLFSSAVDTFRNRNFISVAV